MAEREPHDIVANYVERVWNLGDRSAVVEYCADPYVRHDAGRSRVMSHAEQLERVTSERLAGTAADGRSLHFETLLLAGDGQDVTWVWNMTGPTGTELAASGVEAEVVGDELRICGTMALLGIPYTIVTSIITALSIGIGVDYTIHVIHRYREEFSRLRNPEKAAIRTLATTGSALLGSALTTALGFAVLTFSPLQSFAEFGITAAITIAYALIVSILVVPPAMTVWGAYQNMRLRSMVERLWDDLDVAIEDTHRRFDEGEESS